MSRFENAVRAGGGVARLLADLVPRRFDPKDVAICTIHGASDSYRDALAERCAWPKLQMEQLRKHTPPGFAVYAYGNEALPSHEEFLRSCPEVRLYSSREHLFKSYQTLFAVRNWLAHQAMRHHRFIVHLDSDAFPVRDGWLEHYAGELCSTTPVVAVQRVENGDHHSDRCFLMYRRFDLHLHLFDFANIGVVDTGAGISADLERKGLGWKALRRTNSCDYHPVIAGIYDDRIYHHAAGTRQPRLRYNESLTDLTRDPADSIWDREKRTHRYLMERLFQNPEGFLAELRGASPPVEIEVAPASTSAD